MTIEWVYCGGMLMHHIDLERSKKEDVNITFKTSHRKIKKLSRNGTEVIEELEDEQSKLASSY